MSFGVDASENYKTWGNVQAVKLTSRATIGDTLFDISVAKRRAPTFKELAPSGGVYTNLDVVWLLPKTLVDAAEATGLKAPKPGDLVTAEGVAWTILECPLNTLRSTYRCMTRDLILAYDLRGTLSVKRPTAEATTDDAGGRTYTESVVYNGIACRFQEISSETSDERGKRVTVKRYTVTVNQRLRLTIEDQIVDDAGEVYEVTGWDNADRIDQLMTLECRKAWGEV